MYDDPMSLDDVWADEQRRRMALAYAGAPVVPDGNPAKTTPVPTSPTAPPSSDFAALAQRYLEAQKQDRQDAIFSKAATGLDAAARTINAGAGFNQPSMIGGPEVPSRAAGVLDAARIEAMGMKTPAAKVAAAGKALPSPEEIEKLHAFARARWPKEPEDVIAAITPANLKEIRTTLDAKYGIQSREGLAADAGARDEAKTKQGDVHFWAKMQQDAEQFGVSDATRRYIAEQALKAAQAARDEAAATKEKDKADAVNVPGYEPTPDATPTPKDAETLKTINQANAELTSSVSALRDLHRRFGPSYAGAAGTQTRQIMTSIKLAAKTIADLGALSGPDMGLMDALAGGDPSTIESVAKSTFGVDNTQAAMDGLVQWAQRRIAAAAKARGYRPKSAAPPRTTPDKALPKDAAGNPTLDAPPLKAGNVRVREKSTGRMKDLAPDAAAKVLADPAYEKVTP